MCVFTYGKKSREDLLLCFMPLWLAKGLVRMVYFRGVVKQSEAASGRGESDCQAVVPNSRAAQVGL